jgi:tetraacyldisaccharide 4'-kinase
LLSLVRKFLYHIGLLSTYHFDVAVVVVGNITVGGSGKTPIHAPWRNVANHHH